MTTINQDRVSVKLFAGYMLTSDLRFYLKQSINWKQAKIMDESGTRDLVETHFQNKDYIGSYSVHECLTLNKLKEIEAGIYQALLKYCPELSQETPLKLQIFPQIFIS